ncbi:MAG: hypothetical protein FWF81_11715 [Defluviitaleaceae bacterium]|nr:hypothetical protein [Defluviitaleaceae bacterium]
MQAVKGNLSNGLFTPFEKIVLPTHAEVMLVFGEAVVTAEKPKRQLGFLKDKLPPLPDSFFDPLPEEDLKAWGL